MERWEKWTFAQFFFRIPKKIAQTSLVAVDKCGPLSLGSLRF